MSCGPGFVGIVQLHLPILKRHVVRKLVVVDGYGWVQEIFVHSGHCLVVRSASPCVVSVSGMRLRSGTTLVIRVSLNLAAFGSVHRLPICSASHLGVPHRGHLGSSMYLALRA